MIAAIRNYAGIVAPGWLDLLALPERKEDEPDHKQAECNSEPLVQCHHVSFVGRIRASVQISNDRLPSRLPATQALPLLFNGSGRLVSTESTHSG